MKLVIILQLVLLTSVTAAATDPNLVGWWKLDEGTGSTVFDSAGARNGTVFGATWAAGQTGVALSFDGVNDYVELPNNDPVWLPQNDLTVSTWVYFGKDPSCSTVEFVLGFNFTYWGDQNLCLGYCIHRNWCDGKAVFQMETATATDKLYSNDVLLKNKWYHIAAVRQGTAQKIYLDGQLNGTGVCSSAPVKFSGQCNDHKVNIGKASDGCGTPGNYFLNGMVDDVRIYNRALSAEEIQQLYEETLPTLTGLEITGPNEVAEESTASYKAVAHYSNRITKDVTALAEWRAEPNTVADINGGQLTTGQALYPKQKIKIYAEYTENQTTVDANLPVSIIAICPQGNALAFDGLNDYVQIPNSQNNQITTNQMSISTWVKLNRDVGATQRRIICKQQTNPLAWGLEIGGNGYAGLVGNQVIFHDSSGLAYRNCISPTNLIPGSWYHIGVSDNAGKIRLYINGILNQSIDNGYGIPAQITAPILIGKHPESVFYFDGIIDEVAVFDRALSAGEIQAIMNTKLTGGEPNLVAYWDFDEGMGQTANDVSGHGNNGVLGNNAGIDTADPCWVESDAPVGRCTTEQVLLRNLLGATDNKEVAGQLIADAKAKERASVQLITELQTQMNNKEKVNATRAKAQISVAILQEEIVSRQIDATIDRLEDALRLLNYEVDSNSGPPRNPLWPSCFGRFGNRP